MKKTVCALLCAALAVTLACPAFAANIIISKEA